jgi:DNA polymerase alpha subunit B
MTSLLTTTLDNLTMASVKSELNELFAVPPISELPPDILGELQSTLRLHSISPQELSYKWESYTMKMGSERTQLDLPTARAFKKDIQEMLERESRAKAHVRSVEKKSAHATPRNAAKGGDVFDMWVTEWSCHRDVSLISR